jgi:CBS domain containing-hemolysin-like protein
MIWWVLLVLSLLFSFLLSGIESAVLSVSRVRVRHAADEGDKKASVLLRLIADRDALLGAVTVVNHVFNLIAFSIIAWAIVRALGVWGYAVSFLVALPVFLIGLEVLPKTLFRRYPFRMLRALLAVVRVPALFCGVFKKIRHLQTAAGDGEDASTAVGREDLKQLAQGLVNQKALPPAAATLISRVLDFKRLRTAAVMVPFTRITAVPPDMPLQDALRLASQHSYSALPVLAAEGGFTGILEVAALPSPLPLDRLVRQHMKTLEDSMSTDSALHTLQRLRKRGRTLAVVREPGTNKALGIVTEEDLLKPLLTTTGKIICQ